MITLWVSGVSPAAAKVCVSTALLDGLNLMPEGVHAGFVGERLLVLRRGVVWAVRLFSSCWFPWAGPGLHAHLGGAGISGADIHTRKEITRMHANKWQKIHKDALKINTGKTVKAWGGVRWMNEPGEQTAGETKGVGWRKGRREERERWQAHTKGGLYCSWKKWPWGKKYLKNIH